MASTPRVLDVLLVEDDEDTREVLVGALHERGLEPRPCTNGEEALALLSIRHFDAMVTDHVMPGMTGLELVHRARNVDAELRCVVISGYPAPRGADVPWLQKPFSIGALVEAVTLRPGGAP